MTGFARAEGEADGVSWAWELKSVNARSLDLRLRLPPGFDPLEPQLRAGLARRCRRGNIAAAPPRLDGLIGLRGVIETVEDEPASVVEARHAAVLDGWSLALDRLVTARTEEGARLAVMLAEQRSELAALVDAGVGCAAAQPAAIRG